MTIRTMRFRDGDKIITTKVKVEDAIIDFNDILDVTEVVVDVHNYDAPWDNCDGYAHTTGFEGLDEADAKVFELIQQFNG